MQKQPLTARLDGQNVEITGGASHDVTGYRVKVKKDGGGCTTVSVWSLTFPDDRTAARVFRYFLGTRMRRAVQKDWLRGVVPSIAGAVRIDGG